MSYDWDAKAKAWQDWYEACGYTKDEMDAMDDWEYRGIQTDWRNGKDPVKRSDKGTDK